MSPVTLTDIVVYRLLFLSWRRRATGRTSVWNLLKYARRNPMIATAFQPSRQYGTSVSCLVPEAIVYYKLPLIFEPQPEGGYTVPSPLLPELITEGETVADAMENVHNALAAVLEIYQEQGKPLPPHLIHASPSDAVRVEMVVAVP